MYLIFLKRLTKTADTRKCFPDNGDQQLVDLIKIKAKRHSTQFFAIMETEQIFFNSKKLIQLGKITHCSILELTSSQDAVALKRKGESGRH
jgi:hypothetical protein